MPTSTSRLNEILKSHEQEILAEWIRNQSESMATRRDLVHAGIGTALLRDAMTQIANATAVRLFWCNARAVATGFYERLGWRIVSDVFEVPTAGPHYVMTYALKRVAVTPRTR